MNTLIDPQILAIEEDDEVFHYPHQIVIYNGNRITVIPINRRELCNKTK